MMLNSFIDIMIECVYDAILMVSILLVIAQARAFMKDVSPYSGLKWTIETLTFGIIKLEEKQR